MPCPSDAAGQWSRESLLEFLQDRAIAYQETHHAAVYTMAESAQLAHSLRGCRCKNLLVQNKNKTRRFMVVTDPDATVDLRELGRVLGAGRLSLCAPSDLTHLLGIEQGAVSPLALIGDGAGNVQLVMDGKLKRAPDFLLHPLLNTSTISMSNADLMRFLAEIGHSPIFVDMPLRA